MISFPNAKINLGLNIVNRRTDGYHDIETVFYPITLCDALELVESKSDKQYSFFSKGINVDADVENNLITKAYNLLKKEYDIPNIEVYLQKNIPFGAGLGGGSADAAFMLRMLNEYFNLKISTSELEKYTAQLGADCPFFIQNKPVYATQIGNVFQEINISLKGKYLVLVKPNVYVSTADAYAQVKPQKSAVSLFDIIQTVPIAEWKNTVKNDFEKTVFLKYPTIEKIKIELYEKGAVYASMSGSGSSVFGIFDKEINLKHLFTDCFVWNGYLD